MGKRIARTKGAVKRAVQTAPTLDAAARLLGCSRPGLSLYLARELAPWYREHRRRRRIARATARRRRHRHRVEARQLAAMVAADPRAWDRMTPRQQALVRARITGAPPTVPGGPLPAPA